MLSVHNQRSNGQTVRVLAIIDAITRYAPAIEVRFRWRKPVVADVRESIGEPIG